MHRIHSLSVRFALAVVSVLLVCSIHLAAVTPAAASKPTAPAETPSEVAPSVTLPAETAPAGTGILKKLDRPGDHEFIVDKAGLLDGKDIPKIEEICRNLLKEKATPIIVVTINSLAEHGGAGMSIETFATLLFNQWGIGHAKFGGANWNTGILLLVSKGDRKARIELGGFWRRDQDSLAQQIMNEQIVPLFKADNYSGGILAGVESLDKMARGLKLPEPPPKPASTASILLTVALIGLAIFTVVSLVRRGSGGWAWVFWGLVFAALGYLLYQFLTSSRSSSGGGGFGGGSFGGGFSGGGGATGSW